MKILLITSFFPPTHTAGTEKRTFGYAKTLLERGHQIQVLCAGIWDEGQEYWNGYTDEVYKDIPVRRIHLNWTLAPDPNRFLYYNPVVEKHLKLWLLRWKPDIVHITSCTTLSASVINAVRDQNLPLVLTLTDFWFKCPRINLLRGDGSLCDGRTTAWQCLKCMLWQSKILKITSQVFPEQISDALLTAISRHPFITKQRGLRGMALNMQDRKRILIGALEGVDFVSAPSRSLSETFENSGVSHSIKVIHSGHDLSWLTNQPDTKRDGVIRIGYIGQIIPIKGVHVLISAFMNIPRTDRTKLVIYGDVNKDPGYMTELKTIMEKKANANIEFLGSFPHELLGETLASIDLLVVPSQWQENNPRVIQEAFASKTPVIASNVGGISEFVEHEKNGLLFDRGDVEELTAQLLRIVDEPSLLNQLRSGIQAVKSISEEISEFEEIYKDLIARRNKSSRKC